MENKKFFGSLMAFALTILLFAATIFAWFTLTNKSDVDELILKSDTLFTSAVVEISKNGGSSEVLITVNDFQEMFENSVPSDYFTFKITISSDSTRISRVRVEASNITYDNLEGLDDYDLRNVYYVRDGKIFVNGTEERILDVVSEDEKYLFGQKLNMFNLNNVMIDNKILLLPSRDIGIEENLVIEFTLVYDQETSERDYQTSTITIHSINILTS